MICAHFRHGLCAGYDAFAVSVCMGIDLHDCGKHALILGGYGVSSLYAGNRLLSRRGRAPAQSRSTIVAFALLVFIGQMIIETFEDKGALPPGNKTMPRGGNTSIDALIVGVTMA